MLYKCEYVSFHDDQDIKNVLICLLCSPNNSDHASSNRLKLAVPKLGGEIILVSPPQLFLSINLMSWNFYMIFWGVIIEWLLRSEILYRRCQTSSTLFRGLWNMVDFWNIVKFMTKFQFCVLSREIRVLRTSNPGAKKLLNFLKNRFASSNSTFELFMGHRGICEKCK